MKHTKEVTILLLMFFLIAQFLGLAVVYRYIDQQQSIPEKVVFKEIPFVERPALAETTTFIPVIITILIGTIILLMLLKYKLIWVLKAWFLTALMLTLFVAFNAFMPTIIAFMIALPAALWRILKPNFWVQNLTELFVYGGLAAVFVPLFNLTSSIILLILISGYDAYAVWKSKHMIHLAQSQAQAKLFAGLLIPYRISKTAPQVKTTAFSKIKPKMGVRTAILGGGDIGFPLIFAGTVLKELGFWPSLLIPIFSGAALALLFWKADEKKFYPAMPFISAGCFVGLGIILIIKSIF